MSDNETALAELEQRVTAKLAAAMPRWELPDTDPIEPLHFDTSVELPADWPQFPRERWATYPGRRAQALVMADWAIDHGLLSEAAFLVTHGGRVRVA